MKTKQFSVTVQYDETLGVNGSDLELKAVVKAAVWHTLKPYFNDLTFKAFCVVEQEKKEVGA